MPRYRFNLKNGALIPDPKGTILPDLAAVRERAANLARNLITRIDQPHRDWSSVMIVVTDDEGSAVLEIPVSEAAHPAEETG